VAVALETLRDYIANAVAVAKAYDVPSICVRLGLQDSVEEHDEHLAFNSKRKYVRSKLISKNQVELIEISRRVVLEFDDETLSDALSELTEHSSYRISELVRIDILKALNPLGSLFGENLVLDELAALFGEQKIRDDTLGHLGIHCLEGMINQWYIKNADWSHQELLTQCGALTCSQTRFFKLLERLLHPIIRRDAVQAKLADEINNYLKRDGFMTRPVSSQSGYTIYGVVRANVGVDGQVKNIIFASIGEKPELVFRDAINNDVEIVKNANNVLVFDRQLPSNGALLWKDLAGWWADKHALQSVIDAKAPLYRRLKQSVVSANSPGEFALFKTYYKHYGQQMLDRLPALIPQVFLHYDPYTKRQRGDEQFLSRQRMDFLMMFENGIRVVIEIDGRHHYADEGTGGSYAANARKYAEMAKEDRWLKLSGYEVYRFGGAEFKDINMKNGEIGTETEMLIVRFFAGLFDRHNIS
jgi:very-short-patch-repair endonuclease